MRKIFFLSFFLFAFTFSLLKAEDIAGFWQTIDKETKRPSSVIAIYFYQGKYYGRIIGTYNNKGELDDTIYHPISRAPGIEGNPYYCGLDIVLDATLEEDGKVYQGRVVDPREGKIYRAELWRKDKDLVLRGELFVFGKNVVWPPFPQKNFNKNFKEPDVTKFVPNIPRLKK